MPEQVSDKHVKRQAYSAPALRVYGSVATLTASGTGSAFESSGGTCGVTPPTKNKC